MAELIQRGGIILVVIMAAFLLAIIIIIERFIYLRNVKIEDESIISRVKHSLGMHRINEAMALCEESDCPAANLIKVGIHHRNRPENSIRDAILSASSLEIPKMERFLNALGTIAHITPLLGLLGTVTGNIDTFGVLGEFGADAEKAELAKGVAEALITTAAGIIVSIPSVIFYNYLVTKVNNMIIRLETRVNDIVYMLKTPATTTQTAPRPKRLSEIRPSGGTGGNEI